MWAWAANRAGIETTTPTGCTYPSHSRCARCSGSTAIVSPCHRPEVYQAHRLNAGGLHIVHGTDALGFSAQLIVEHRQAPGPVALVCFQLPAFVRIIANGEGELPGVHLLMPGHCRGNVIL